MNFTIMTGDNRDTLKNLADNSVDAIVTDPPYGIDFLGKAWDANTGALETYTECLRVLKPGGHILAFSAARTYHHLAITLEQAGFEIRDQIMWLYGSGFPKAHDVGKAIQKRKGVEKTKPLVSNGPANGMARMTHNQSEPAKYAETKNAEDIVLTDSEAQAWEGWKTALKPAHEPICMARKPFRGSTIDNVLEHGVGALNIDATRINTEQPLCGSGKKNLDGTYTRHQGQEFGQGMMPPVEYDPTQGRFPSNVLGEVEGYQKFFYCPKVSRRERHCGFEQKNIPTDKNGMYDGFYENGEFNNSGGSYINKKDGSAIKNKKHDPLAHIPTAPGSGLNQMYGEGQGAAHKRANAGNNHPTVKPVELMKYLIKLVTPANSTVLDPFCGSGSTGMAAVELGHRFIGCEMDPNYVAIAETRIQAWNTPDTDNNFQDLFEE